MTIDERIKYAEQKRDEAFSNGSLQSLCYWDGYIAALKAVSDESGYRKASEVAREIFEEIEAVRCKDCVHWTDTSCDSRVTEAHWGECRKPLGDYRYCETAENDYCSYGERKDENEG